MRKFILALCLIMIFSYTLPLFIRAEVPDNDVDVTFSLDILDIDASSNYASFNVDQQFETGSLYVLTFNSLVPDSVSGKVTLHFTIDLSINTPVNFYLLESFDFLSNSSPSFSLEPIYVVDRDSSESIPLSSLVSLSPFSYSGSYTPVRYYYDFRAHSISHVSSVPEYTSAEISFCRFPTLTGRSYRFQFRVYVSSSDGSFDIPLGFFFDQPLSGDPLTDYQNGDITFSAASNAIRSEIDQIMQHPTLSNYEKQTLLGLTSYKLEQLQAISDEKFSQVVNTFDDQSSDIVDSYILSGSTDISPVLSQLNSSYTDAITQAVTPEQADLILSRHSLRLSQIQAVFDVNYKQEIDSVITDEDLQNKAEANDRVSELLESESRAIQLFEDSNIQSHLNFFEWLARYDNGDYRSITVIKGIFDFFFENPAASNITPFLVIPFSLVLIGALLATTTVVMKGGRHG